MAQNSNKSRLAEQLISTQGGNGGPRRSGHSPLLDALMDSGGGVGQIDMDRPRISNPDGTFSTEETITIDIETPDGKRFFNIPTIVGGKRVGEERAVDMFLQGNNPAVGEFLSLDEALDVARARSKRIGEVRKNPNEAMADRFGMGRLY